MKNIWTVLKKEVKRFFSDKRTAFVSIVLPGLLIYFIYSIMGSAIEDLFAPEEGYQPAVYAVNMPDGMEDVFKNMGIDAKYTLITASEADAKKQEISGGEADILLVFPEDFMRKIEEYDPESGLAAPQVEIYFNSAETESQNAYILFESALNAFESSLSNRFDINAGGGIYDLATKEDIAGKMFSMMLPFLIIIFLVSSSMAFAMESVAGEKERGTIGTILITPIKRWELAVGKILGTGCLSLLSALSSFLGIVLSLPKLMGTESSGVEMNVYGAQHYLLILLIMLVSVLIIVAGMMLLSAFAKNMKEANMYTMPFMIICMVIGLSGMLLSGKNLPLGIYFIPLFNSIQAMSAILSFNINGAAIAITIVSDIVYFGVMIWLLTVMFNNEKIMFKKD